MSQGQKEIKKFSFTKPGVPTTREAEKTTFTGHTFYGVYKDAEFLRHSDNIETILSKGYLLRQTLKETAPGDTIMVEGMNLEKNTPLLIKKTGANVKVEDYEFTLNRLTGLVATYAFDNRLRFPAIVSSEATALGLAWDNANAGKCRLYLSAVTGTEHFYEQFSFWPLVCALRKYQLKKITPELVVKMARIKNNKEERLAKELMRNMNIVKMLWDTFPGSSAKDFEVLKKTATPDMKLCFPGFM